MKSPRRTSSLGRTLGLSSMAGGTALAAPVLTDLRGLPEAARTLVRPTEPQPDLVYGQSFLHLDVDAGGASGVIDGSRTATPSSATADITLISFRNFDPRNVNEHTSVDSAPAPSATHGAVASGAFSDIGKGLTSVTKFNAGVSIGPGTQFAGQDGGESGDVTSLATAYYTSSSGAAGYFPPSSSGYMGFRFKRGTALHYGFAYVRLNAARDLTVDWVGWENSPGTAIATAAPAGVAPVPPKPVATLEGTGANREIRLTWPDVPGTTYAVQQSTNMVAWTAASGTVTTAGGNRVYSEPVTGGSAKYLRIVANP